MKPNVQLQGKLASILTAITSEASQPDIGSLEIALSGYGSQVPRVHGEAVFSNITVIDIMNPITDPAAGTFEFLLYSNDSIQPAGTYYTILTKNNNGDIVQAEAYVFAPGLYDFSQLTPFDPNQPLPVLPVVEDVLQVVPYSETPEFAGDIFTSWQITLQGDAAATFTNLVDGNLYTIIIIQDATGAHQFDFPDNAFNTTAINPDPNGMTIQTFVAISDQLFPIGAGTFQ